MTVLRATCAVVAAAITSSSMVFPAAAYAEGGDHFQSPSGSVYCAMGINDDDTGRVTCQGGGNYPVPKPVDCHLAWGDRFSLQQGDAPVSACHGDTIVPSHDAPGAVPGVPILDDGHTVSAGAITCLGEFAGIRCTDTGTGHYFLMSRSGNELR